MRTGAGLTLQGAGAMELVVRIAKSFLHIVYVSVRSANKIGLDLFQA